MRCFLACSVLGALAFASTAPLFAGVPPDERATIDRIIGGKGAYSKDDGAYRVILPREAATIVQDWQRLSPNLGLNSWVTFSSGAHQESILAGQFLLLEDEVNPVLTVALRSGLEITALVHSSVFDGPQLYTLDVCGRGRFSTLAEAFRKGLDEVIRVRQNAVLTRVRPELPSVPLDSGIDARPLDSALSIKGTVIEGVYKAAIGKKTSIHGEVINGAMGITTWVSVAGTNESAVANGEFVETVDDVQKVLKALRSKGINIESVRNHKIGEQPQCVYIRFWGQGPAVELAKAIRYVLEVDAGATPASEQSSE